MNMLRRLVCIALAVSPGSLAADSVLIENARLHTVGPQGSLAGDMLVVDGRIEAVGEVGDVSQDVRRIDAKGRPVTPGLFSTLSRIGLVEIDAVMSTSDASVDLPKLGPSVRVEAALNPESIVWRQALVAGVTHTVSAPNFAQTPFAGMSVAIRLGTAKAPVIRRDVSMMVAMGEAGSALSGNSRAGNVALIEQAFADAQEYNAIGRWHEGYAFAPHDLRTLVEAHAAKLPLAILANRASDIRAAVDLVGKVGLPLIIVGGVEAWKVADELAAAEVPVVLFPMSNLPSRFESLGARLDNAVVLFEAGVDFAVFEINPHDTVRFRQSAGNLVAEGLPWDVALESITLAPARIWGLDAESGSLEPGKVADFVIWSGDPLEVTTWPEQVFVAGKPINMRSRQDDLFERYESLPPH
ncbi:MAG: amidohydrolase family protein [Gammaproteobacteria bacterium]|nr:amidohydrolase family protein [Gammaproteobacteria bacterium]MCY4198227.1 amidohydrolase family protein [Gammaproteobacteria bacterium]MCY4323587.1 amidohydrolase family protein [Gammaproteobacteria bacterium]